MKPCPWCNEPYDEAAGPCPRCAAQPQEESPEELARAQRTLKIAKIAGAGFLVLVVLAIVFLSAPSEGSWNWRAAFDGTKITHEGAGQAWGFMMAAFIVVGMGALLLIAVLVYLKAG